MSDLNQILDEILNNPLYSTGEGNQAEPESDSRVRSSNDEVPNSDESDDDADLDQSDASKNHSVLKVTNNPLEETEDLLQRNLQPRRLRRKSEENDDEDDCQHVPDVPLPEKAKTFPEDENNRDHPTYVPRKGKFFEHDDRTSNEQRATKQSPSEIPKGKTRPYRDADGKWPHDLYFRDQQVLKSPRNGVRAGHVVNRTHQSNQPDAHLPSTLRRPPGFTTKDQHPTHYQRKFINRQYQQTADKGLGEQRPRRRSLPSADRQERDPPPPRKPIRTVEVRVEPPHQRSARPKSHHEGLENRSRHVHQPEQPKRYSNMRQTLHHSRPQQPANPPTRNDWPQVPLSPSTFFSQQSKLTSSYWYPQTSPDISTGQSPQVSRYFPTASAFQHQ